MRGARTRWVAALALALAAAGCSLRQRGVAEATTDPALPPAPGPVVQAPVDPPREPAAEPPSPESTRIRDAIARARELLAVLDGRGLTPAHQLNVQSAGSFTLQAVQALEEDDLERAAVLSDKALTLLEAVESETRPEPE